jgi:hypothetical protein
MRHLGSVSLAALLMAIPAFTQPGSANDEALSIVHLAFRDHIVTITSSPQGPRYSVRTTSGTVLSEDLTEDRLLAAHPRLHSHIRSSIASDESGSFIWAGRSESLIESAIDATTSPD